MHHFGESGNEIENYLRAFHDTPRRSWGGAVENEEQTGDPAEQSCGCLAAFDLSQFLCST
jgi:hypothetical protein